MIKDTEAPSGQNESGRRGFLKKLWIGLGIIAFAEVIGIMFSYLRPRKKQIEAETFGSIVTAGSVDDFENNSVTAFRRGQFYLVRLDDGGFMALSRKCTHLGCTVPWVKSEKQFICPCHSSAFNIKGEVLKSPAPRPMDMFTVTIENKMVKVNTDKRMKRDRFDASQAVYL